MCKSCTSFLRRLSGEYMYSLRTFQIRASVFSRARCANRPAAAVALRKFCQRVSVFGTSIPRCVFCVCRPQLRGIFGDQLGCEAVDTVRCLAAGCHQRGTLLFRFPNVAMVILREDFFNCMTVAGMPKPCCAELPLLGWCARPRGGEHGEGRAALCHREQ